MRGWLLAMALVGAAPAWAQAPSRLEAFEAFWRERAEHERRGEAAQSAESLRAKAFQDLVTCQQLWARTGATELFGPPGACEAAFRRDMARAAERDAPPTAAGR